MKSFKDLQLIEPINRALQSEGYEIPTPIQSQSIPIILQERDLLGCAQTGTGKTAAFAIPIIQLLVNKHAAKNGKRTIQALIVTPTRELAIQIGENFNAYSRFTHLKSTVIFGGVPQGSQVNALKAGVDILIATPGRLLDLQSQGIINLNALSIFVLDEADRMLDMGFVHDIRKLIKIIPAKRQTLFFSATMPKDIAVLANTILTNPAQVSVAPVSSTADTVNQVVYLVEKNDKNDLLLHIMQDRSIKTALVFTRTKHGADKVAKILVKNEITAEAIHGNKSQNARQRALTNFKNKTTRVLVATDIAARGIDIDELAFVVNFEIPNIPETYVHRIGRTGRAGTKGKAISFCDMEERAYLKDIQKIINKTIPVEENHPYPSDGKMPPPKPKQPQQNSFKSRPQQGNANKPKENTEEKPKKRFFRK